VPLLSKNGLTHSWDTQQDANGLVTVTCHVEHAAGHSKSVTLRAMPDSSGAKNSVQAIGSTITYLARYTFLAALGIAQADLDDDGAGSGGEAKVTADQVGEINDLLVNTKTDLKRFLAWAEVDALDSMPAAMFAKAIDFLNKKKSKQGGAKQ
jgi:hypothetical protein